MLWHERQRGGEKGRAKAEAALARVQAGQDPRSAMPDRLFSVGWKRIAGIKWISTASGRSLPMMELEERGTGHILLDIDECADLPEVAPEGLIDCILSAVLACPLFSGVSTVVRTSTNGLQVVARLARFRWDVPAFFDSPEVHLHLASVGRALTDLVGGIPDPSAWAPNRHGRAPGWRLRAKHGTVTVERAVLWHVDSEALADGPARKERAAAWKAAWLASREARQAEERAALLDRLAGTSDEFRGSIAARQLQREARQAHPGLLTT